VSNNKTIDMSSLKISGVDTKDHPDYSDAYFCSGKHLDGTKLDDNELEALTDKFPEIVNGMASEESTDIQLQQADLHTN